jgi:hypothetical protein
MSLSQTTRVMIAEVERVTGYPFLESTSPKSPPLRKPRKES